MIAFRVFWCAENVRGGESQKVCVVKSARLEKMITKTGLRRLAAGGPGEFVFDLARISRQKFGDVVKGLESFGVSMVKSLTFTIGSKDSVADVAPGYCEKLVRVVGRLVRESSVLNDVHFVEIEFDRDDVRDLAKALKVEGSLKAVEFRNVELGDELVALFLKELGSCRPPSLAFVSCGLSSGVFGCVVEFIENVLKKHGQSAVPSLDLTGNDTALDKLHDKLSEQGELAEIFKTKVRVDDIVAKESDEQTTVTEEVIADEASVEYRLPERPEDDDALVNFFHQDKRLENLSDASEEDRLFSENQRLRVQIDRLKGIIYEVNNHDALFVLGDGCYSVVDFMNSLQARLEKLLA